MNRIRNTETEQMIREATKGLTGRREKDILFLRAQIDRFSEETPVSEALRRILSALTGAQLRKTGMIPYETTVFC